MSSLNNEKLDTKTDIEMTSVVTADPVSTPSSEAWAPKGSAALESNPDAESDVKTSDLIAFQARAAVKYSKYLLIGFYSIVALAAILIIYDVSVKHEQTHVVAWAVAAIFVGIAIPLSLRDIYMHMIHYVRPELQKYYIRILWMVPIYCLESWFALRFKNQKIWFEVFREAYEAYVIYSFYSLLRRFLGTREELVALLEAKPNKYAKTFFPLCFLRPWKMGNEFVTRTFLGVFQYVFLRFTFAFLVLILHHLDLLGEGQWSAFNRGFVYIMVTINFSQAFAMYNLVMFYKELRKDLDALRPIGKFLSVKLVVFFCFWQGIIISLLSHSGAIKASGNYSKEDVSMGIKDFLICIEMAFAAAGHKFFFSYNDFRSPEMMATKSRTEHAALVDEMRHEKNLEQIGMGERTQTGRVHHHHPVMKAVIDMVPVDVFVDVAANIKHGINLLRGRTTTGNSNSNTNTGSSSSGAVPEGAASIPVAPTKNNATPAPGLTPVGEFEPMPNSAEDKPDEAWK